jgi:glycine cleavage system H protein
MPDKFYTEDHEWLQIGEDGLATIGITQHAQNALGDIVFVELPEPGRSIVKGEGCAVVENNPEIVEEPALINKDPEQAAWFFRMRLEDPAAIAGLMGKADYDKFVEGL